MGDWGTHATLSLPTGERFNVRLPEGLFRAVAAIADVRMRRPLQQVAVYIRDGLADEGVLDESDVPTRALIEAAALRHGRGLGQQIAAYVRAGLVRDGIIPPPGLDLRSVASLGLSPYLHRRLEQAGCETVSDVVRLGRRAVSQWREDETRALEEVLALRGLELV
jgi:hypothetical protein